MPLENLARALVHSNPQEILGVDSTFSKLRSFLAQILFSVSVTYQYLEKANALQDQSSNCLGKISECLPPCFLETVSILQVSINSQECVSKCYNYSVNQSYSVAKSNIKD